MKGGKIATILVAIVVASDCYAQFTDTFSDGDFINTPAWSGDNSKFTINAGKLKLQAPVVSDVAFLSTSSQAIHQASWEFYLQMDFTPSSTNYTKVYLVSDQPNLVQPLNGYFVKIGNTSRDVSLYRQSGTTETRIIDGLDDRVNGATVKMKIKVLRNTSAEWQLFSDTGPSGTYSSEGIATDNNFSTSSYFGMQCTYTSTRSDKFWFDDFIVSGMPTPDTSPPLLISATALGPQEVSLVFSEVLDQASAENPANYQVLTLGLSAQAILQPDRRSVRLYLNSQLVNGLGYTLQLEGIKDAVGNAMPVTQLPLLFFQATPSKWKDIIFTEVFPDPSPQIGLPNSEFVEIHNRSQSPFNLAGWKLTDGSSIGIFPSQIILPGEYWIITGTSSLNSYSTYGKTLAVSNFPTLNNGGDILVLRNPDNFTIDSLQYTIGWYRDVDKQEGGWTLELIDPDNPCGEEDNWEASADAKGGTPGKQNSVLASKPDLTAPSLVNIFPEQPTRLALAFNEKLDHESLASLNFVLHPTMVVSRASFKDESRRTILVDLVDSLIRRQPYDVEISNIMDCNGNVAERMVALAGLPEKPDSMDVVINEILFNPRAGGVDFVEIFNASEKFLDLIKWKVGNIENGTPTDIVELFDEHKLLSPGSYGVFTPSPGAVALQYPKSVGQNFYKVTLPSLPDDQGSIVLIGDQGMAIDAVSYYKEWHSTFVNDEEGVSLERIVPRGRSNDRMNWTSAASVIGFATPGFVNSQLVVPGDLVEGDVKVVPEAFAPGSGAKEFVQIEYHFDQGGWVANVMAIDQQQRILKNIATNETIGPDGFFRWDGDRDDGSKARMGYYVIWFEIFRPDGYTKTFRKRVIVSSRE